MSLTHNLYIDLVEKLDIIEGKKKCVDEEIVLGRVFQDHKELFKEIKMNHNS